nr:MAG TPA: hypothetical protein [Caudoviricetes sp.]
MLNDLCGLKNLATSLGNLLFFHYTIFYVIKLEFRLKKKNYSHEPFNCWSSSRKPL